jgi:hypothetical protein
MLPCCVRANRSSNTPGIACQIRGERVEIRVAHLRPSEEGHDADAVPHEERDELGRHVRALGTDRSAVRISDSSVSNYATAIGDLIGVMFYAGQLRGDSVQSRWQRSLFANNGSRLVGCRSPAAHAAQNRSNGRDHGVADTTSSQVTPYTTRARRRRAASLSARRINGAAA